MARLMRDEGPLLYTRSVLEVMEGLSSDPVERASLARAVLLLGKRKFWEYRNTPYNIGIINTKEAAIRALVDYFASQISWMDAQTKLAGKAVYVKKVRETLALLSKKIGYSGKWDALAGSLVRRASAYWDW